MRVLTFDSKVERAFRRAYTARSLAAEELCLQNYTFCILIQRPIHRWT